MSILTVRDNDSWVKWELDEECLRTVKPIAQEFGMSVERFLELFTLDKLPAQLPQRDFTEDQDNDIELPVDVTALTRSPAWPRIQRAAVAEGLSIKDFLTEAIMDDVRAAEEAMVLSPKTGEPIASVFQLREFIVEEEYRETCEE